MRNACVLLKSTRHADRADHRIKFLYLNFFMAICYIIIIIIIIKLLVYSNTLFPHVKQTNPIWFTLFIPFTRDKMLYP